ncbi:MAG: MFS transporter, partial [Patescibacteria group bacterium]
MFNKKPNWKDYLILKEVNSVIRILTLSDLVMLSGIGLIAPIFAIYITDQIVGATIEVVGIAAAIYLISESIFQIPAAAFIDKIKGERDDFWSLLISSLLFSIIPLFYIIINQPWQLYILQFFYGLIAAVTGPAWYAIFTRHIDKNHEGIEWGIYRTLTSLGAAAAASLGGFIAFRYSFT